MTRQETLLAILAEECGEVTQRVTKILRFGLENKRPRQEFSNAELLKQEFNDLLVAMSMVYETNPKAFGCYVIDEKHQKQKREKVEFHLKNPIEWDNK